MKNKKIGIGVITAVLTIFCYSACKDDFLDTKDTGSLNSDSYYTTPLELLSGVNATYGGLQRNGLYNLYFEYMHSYASDEIAVTQNTITYGANEVRLNEYTFDASYDKFSTNFTDWFATIARANAVIENAPRVPVVGESQQQLVDRIVGEAKFLRAFAYFNLVVDYGKVPLRTTIITEPVLAASPKEEIWQQIEIDLIDAEEVLPKKSEYKPADLGRVTKGAAKALLGKAYLYQKKWSDASTKFKEIIDAGEYSLEADPRANGDNKNENNMESIFEIQFTDGLYQGEAPWAPDDSQWGGGNNEGNLYSGNFGVEGHANYNAKPSNKIVKAFEFVVSGTDTLYDPRFDASVFGPNSKFYLNPKNGNNDEKDYTEDNSYRKVFARAGYAIKKYFHDDLRPYNNNKSNSSNDINIRVIRYADVLLMYAEAVLEDGDVEEAAKYINIVRRRADPTGNILPDRSGDAAQMKEYLVHERQIEFAFEFTRRRDLIRWELAERELGSKFKIGKHEVFPIPQGELDANKLMKQNDGY